MENKNNLALIVIIICFLCLGVGIFDSYNNKDNFAENEGEKSGNSQKIISSDMKVGVIDLSGVIENSGKSELFQKDNSAPGALKSLRAVIDDKDIKGVILRINSPGGTVAMSQSINEEVMRIREKKPIIVLIEDMAASGGYYIACAADRIVAQEGSLTGSIGVIFSTMDFHKLMSEKLLVGANVIKSGKFKDIGSTYREMTNEERELLQNIVDDSYEQFLQTIIRGRVQRNDNYSAEKVNLETQTLYEIADGRIFTGRQAKEYGLIDTLGGINKAQEVIQSMVSQKYNSTSKVKLVSYNKKSNLNEYLFGLTESLFNKQINVSEVFPVSMRLSKRPLYLWE